MELAADGRAALATVRRQAGDKRKGCREYCLSLMAPRLRHARHTRIGGAKENERIKMRSHGPLKKKSDGRSRRRWAIP